MIEHEMVALSTKVINENMSIERDFDTLLGYIQNSDATDRKNLVNNYAYLFWVLCTHFSEQENNNECDVIINIVEILYPLKNQVESTFYKEKEFLFIEFLYYLYHRKDSINEFETGQFIEFYNKIYDSLDSIKWIFSLENATGKRIFPIKDLIENVANTFELDQEHYLQLVFSLEIFKRVDDVVEDDCSAIKNKMLKISDEYNIPLIKFLCDGGRVSFSKFASLNSVQNGTIIVETDEYILIRNTDEAYFDIDDEILSVYKGERGKEGKDLNNPIAYYYYYKKKDEEILEDFNQIFTYRTNKCRLEVLSCLLTHDVANIFLGSCFWVNPNSGAFVRLLNPFGINDEVVISKSGRLVKGSKKFDKFIECIKTDYDEFGNSMIISKGYNVLTLDFVIQMYQKLIGKGNNYLKRIEQDDSIDFYQNKLFKIYIEDSLSNGNIYNGIEKYYLFLKDFYKYDLVNQDSKFHDHNILIMPYKPYIPFDGDITALCNRLIENEYVSGDCAVCELKEDKTFRTRIRYFVDDKEISSDNIMDLSGTPLNENDICGGICISKTVHEDGEEKKYIYLVNTQRNDIQNELIAIKDFGEKAVIVRPENQFRDIDKIKKIIVNIGFSDLRNNFGRNYILDNNSAKGNLALYKLLWHIQFWELNEERYELFRKLVLESYYTEYVLNYEKYVRDFFDDLMIDNNNEKLIIAKESSGEGATLNELFNKYDNGSRGSLKKSFDGHYIDVEYEERDGRCYYKEHEIDEIIITTDNILSGGSTCKMLSFYLNNEKAEKDRRQYLWDESKIVPQILAKNKDIPIKIKTILCTERGEKNISDKFSDYNIEIIPQIRLQDNQFNWTENVENCIAELYEIEPGRRRMQNAQCIFRPINMPFDIILPDHVQNVSLLCGLFQRKEED